MKGNSPWTAVVTTLFTTVSFMKYPSWKNIVVVWSGNTLSLLLESLCCVLSMNPSLQLWPPRLVQCLFPKWKIMLCQKILTHRLPLLLPVKNLRKIHLCVTWQNFIEFVSWKNLQMLDHCIPIGWNQSSWCWLWLRTCRLDTLRSILGVQFLFCSSMDCLTLWVFGHRFIQIFLMWRKLWKWVPHLIPNFLWTGVDRFMPTPHFQKMLSVDLQSWQSFWSGLFLLGEGHLQTTTPLILANFACCVT